MAQDWTSLTLDASGFITIPTTFGGQTIATNLRTVKGSELTYLEGDVTIIDSQIRHYTLIPNSGNSDTLVQILGGHSGADIMLRPDNAAYTITIQDGANLHVPSGTIVLSAVHHMVLFTCIGTDIYAKLLL